MGKGTQRWEVVFIHWFHLNEVSVEQDHKGPCMLGTPPHRGWLLIMPWTSGVNNLVNHACLMAALFVSTELQVYQAIKTCPILMFVKPLRPLWLMTHLLLTLTGSNSKHTARTFSLTTCQCLLACSSFHLTSTSIAGSCQCWTFEVFWIGILLKRN